MKYNTNDSEMKRYRKELLIVLAVVVILAAGFVFSVLTDGAAEPEWDVCYPMANQHIEWTWAGK